MWKVLRSAGVAITLLVFLGACTGLPSPTAPAETRMAATVAPAATEAQGSTEATPVALATLAATLTTESAATTAPESTQLPAEPGPDAAVTPAARIAAAPTEASQPTLPPAPTAAPEATEPPEPTAPAVACTQGALTPAQTEGPYYSQNPPQSSDLLQPGMTGTKLALTGYVLDAQCRPIPGARVDFWQADSEGQYDNQGYTLRGYQVTDAQGRYSVETVVPGRYPGRTRHIHVKVTAPGGPTLTTQLYFPDEAANQSDRIFSPELTVNIEKTGDGETGTFNFVVQTQ